MTERAILYSSPMVRARRAGLKTQTRRVVSDGNSRGNFPASELLLDDKRTFADPGPSPAGNPGWYLHAPIDARKVEARKGWSQGECDPSIIERLYPWVFTGDQLWVREAWRTLAEHDELPPRDVPMGAPLWFESDGPAPAQFGRYRHARFMCRWMSRGLDELTEVRVERLQDISEADCRAEGCYGGHGSIQGYAFSATPREHYWHVWETLNGKGSVDLNPWVWALTFKVLQ